MKYIFIAGAPGSKWSSVAKNIYYGSNIDRSDYNESHIYSHNASGQQQVMHVGAYFDPGMEFDLPPDLTTLSKAELERRFDEPFSGTGLRIIKSHIFSNNIDFIKHTWSECPLVLVYRPDDACLGWWVKCGHFNITYPDYSKHYVNLEVMATRIAEQNAGIIDACNRYDGFIARDNLELADIVGAGTIPSEYKQNYRDSDIEIKII
jgi:hypothetical protein